MYNLVFGAFAGIVCYFYVVDNLGMAHGVGIACALIAGMVVSFIFYAWQHGSAEQLSMADKYDADRWNQ